MRVRDHAASPEGITNRTWRVSKRGRRWEDFDGIHARALSADEVSQKEQEQARIDEEVTVLIFGFTCV